MKQSTRYEAENRTAFHNFLIMVQRNRNMQSTWKLIDFSLDYWRREFNLGVTPENAVKRADFYKR